MHLHNLCHEQVAATGRTRDLRPEKPYIFNPLYVCVLVIKEEAKTRAPGEVYGDGGSKIMTMAKEKTQRHRKISEEAEKRLEEYFPI